jgi:hypothetical protein
MASTTIPTILTFSLTPLPLPLHTTLVSYLCFLCHCTLLHQLILDVEIRNYHQKPPIHAPCPVHPHHTLPSSLLLLPLPGSPVIKTSTRPSSEEFACTSRATHLSILMRRRSLLSSHSLKEVMPKYGLIPRLTSHLPNPQSTLESGQISRRNSRNSSQKQLKNWTQLQASRTCTRKSLPPMNTGYVSTPSKSSQDTEK